jgi:hypothetical protein
MMNNLRENNCSVFDSRDPDPTKWRKIAHVEDPLWGGKYPNPFHMVFSLDSSKLYLSVLHPSPAASGVMVVDTATWTIKKEIQGIGPDLQTPAITYDGKYVVVIYGRLGKTAVGTHERGLFITFETLAQLREIMQQICGTKAALEPNKLSGVLLELTPGATTQQIRFAALANFPGIKVVAGDTMLTSIRQGLAGLLNGMLGLMAIMFASAMLMVSVLFSAIVTERRRELGLLRAIGARRGQVLGVLLTEAALATGAGGLTGCVVGVLLMRVYEHSLVYHLENLGIPFVWLNGGTMALIALLRILFASLIGAAGALCPAGGQAAKSLTISFGRRARRAVLQQSVEDLCDRAQSHGSGQRHRSRPAGWRVHRCRGPLRFRQVVAAGDDRRAEPPDWGSGPDRGYRYLGFA